MNEISIWDDSESFVDAWNSSADGVLHKLRTATRRRGGLHAVVEKAVKARYGTTFADYERGIHGIDRKEVAAAHDLLRDVAGLNPDRDGAGFDKADIAPGHALAAATVDTIVASAGYSLLAISLAAKYRVRRAAERFQQSISGF